MHRTASQAAGLPGGDSASTPTPPLRTLPIPLIPTRPTIEPMRPRQVKPKGKPWSTWPSWTDQHRYGCVNVGVGDDE